MRRLVLINPNSNPATTASMCAIAQRAAPHVEVLGLTAPRGPAMIVDPDALAASADVVSEMARDLQATPPDAVVVGAFGDPGLAAVASLLPCPVRGIGEAAMRTAAEGGRRFAVVTVTPEFVGSITDMAARLGLARLFEGVVLTDGAVADVMASESVLLASLHAACREALKRGVDAIVIGGGPLGAACDQLAPRFPLPLINPVAAAVHLALA